MRVLNWIILPLLIVEIEKRMSAHSVQYTMHIMVSGLRWNVLTTLLNWVLDTASHLTTIKQYIYLPQNVYSSNSWVTMWAILDTSDFQTTFQSSMTTCVDQWIGNFLCEDCVDGFAVSFTSMGHKCSNCTDTWYGIPLYLLIDIAPITVFYLTILIFQIHITSAPMTCFIFYCQMVQYMLVNDRFPPVERIVSPYENYSVQDPHLLLWLVECRLPSLHYTILCQYI